MGEQAEGARRAGALRRSTDRAEPSSRRAFRCEEIAPDDDGWAGFLGGLADLAACHCCGAGLSGATAPVAQKRSALRDPRQWATHPAARGPALPARRGAYVLPDVTVAQPHTPSLAHVDVHVRDGRIIAIRPHGPGANDGDVIVESCRRAFVSPALVDMHAHMPPWNALQLTPLFLLLNLRAGVTIVRDAGDPDGSATPAALAAVRSGRIPGPELHYAYAFVGRGPHRWANALTVDAPEDAIIAVDHIKALGGSWIKSYENLTPDLIAALVKAAHDRGLRVMGHVPTALRLEESGIPDCQHYFGAVRPDAYVRDHVFDRLAAWDSVDAARIDEIIEGSLRGGIAHTPTLSMGRALLAMQDEADPDGFRAAATGLPGFFTQIVWNDRHGLPAYRGLSTQDFDQLRRAFDRKLTLTRALTSAGVQLYLGTDTQQPYVTPGFALHAEMACFRDAGTPAEDVWRMATAGAAHGLGLHDVGAVEPGMRADFIVSSQDPRQGLDRTSFLAVCARGALIETTDLDAAIRAEQSRFTGAFANLTTRWLARMALNRAAAKFIG